MTKFSLDLSLIFANIKHDVDKYVAVNIDAKLIVHVKIQRGKEEAG
jgi:hypothetical protein